MTKDLLLGDLTPDVNQMLRLWPPELALLEWEGA
jgi:hypothetical protein